MDLLETSTQSFVVKIWVEETAEEAGEVLWRGHITHVFSNERHYFASLAEMTAKMTSYLQNAGIGPLEDMTLPHLPRS